MKPCHPLPAIALHISVAKMQKCIWLVYITLICSNVICCITFFTLTIFLPSVFTDSGMFLNFSIYSVIVLLLPVIPFIFTFITIFPVWPVGKWTFAGHLGRMFHILDCVWSYIHCAHYEILSSLILSLFRDLFSLRLSLFWVFIFFARSWGHLI